MTQEDHHTTPDASSPPPATSLTKLDDKTTWSILSQMPIDFWARDAKHHRIVFQSNLSKERWGDMRSDTFDETRFPPELIAQCHKGIERALEGETIHHESTVPVSPGEKRDYRKTFSPIRDKENRIVGVLGINVDITEQKEKERLLTARRKLAEQLNKTTKCTDALKHCFATALLVSRVRTANIYAVDENYVGTLQFHQGHSDYFLEKYTTVHPDPLLKKAISEKRPLIRSIDQYPPEIEALLDKNDILEVVHFPIGHDGQIIAVLNVAADKQQRFPQWCLDELETITTQTEATIARILTQEKLNADRRLLRQLLHMQEQERQLLSSEIHDGFVQDVVGTQMVLETAMQQCLHHHPICETLFDQADTMLGRAIKEARRLISDLRPLIIEEAGVVEAIHFLVDRMKASSPIKILYEHDDVIDRFDPIVEGVVFRIVQEAVTNAIRHSNGTYIKVSITENDKTLFLKIKDDGIGFDPSQVPENRFGIRGITERAALFDGVAKIQSQPSQGTEIIVNLPITRLPNLSRRGDA